MEKRLDVCLQLFKQADDDETLRAKSNHYSGLYAQKVHENLDSMWISMELRTVSTIKRNISQKSPEL